MAKEGPETQYRKKAIGFGSSLLVGSIFTGPAAPFVALAGAAFIAGAGLRHLVNRRARNAYNEERGVSVEPLTESFYPESPETAIARTAPFEASDLLRQYSKDRLAEEALSAASTVARDYLSNLSQERLDRSNGVRVSFERRRNLASFFTGEDAGFKIDIDLK